MVAFNKDCGKIAVANEGEGVYGATGLVDPEGSVSIISIDNDGLSGTVQTVGFASIATSDEDLKAKGVHHLLSSRRRSTTTSTRPRSAVTSTSPPRAPRTRPLRSSSQSTSSGRLTVARSTPTARRTRRS